MVKTVDDKEIDYYNTSGRANLTTTKTPKVALLALLALLPGFALADELTDRAKTLLEQNKATEAFALLDTEENVRAGEVSYDLLLGVSALESGQNTRAVFALERVLAVEPNNARARAEIARAYLAMGDTTAARQEFESVQKQGVPPEVSDTIDRFLDAVDRIDSVTRTTVRGYAEAGLGYDSNVNAATSKSTIAIPGFGGLPFTLDSDSKASESWMSNLAGGLNLRAPINRDVAFVAGASGVLRSNFQAHQFDNLSADAYAGIVVTQDKNVFSFNAQFNQYLLDDHNYRTAAGMSGQWQYNLDARNQFSAFVQYSDLHYPTQEVRDADRWVAGGAFAHAFRGGEVVYASAYGLTEDPQQSGVQWLGFDGFGVRAGGQMNLNAKTVLFAGGAVEYRHYAAEDPSFLTERKDTQYDLTLGVNYTPARNWIVTPRLSFTYNDSNIDLNTYHREVASVVLRRDF